MYANPEVGLGQLRNLVIGNIRPNPRNPRLVFPEDELDRLAASIDQEGILVPIAVFENDDDTTFTLIDGERRYKCAVKLGLQHIPALIKQRQSDVQNLVSMFNIHQMREPWRDIPTATALDELANAIETATGTAPSYSVLAEQTGLSLERVKRLRFASQLPDIYQTYISDGRIPLNWFWELDRNVVQPLAKKRAQIFEEFGEEGVVAGFVTKRLNGVITDTVSLRNVRPIINYAAQDAEESERTVSVLDDTIRKLITDTSLTIATAYEDTVQIMVETDKLQRSTRNLVKGFERILAKTRSETERQTVLQIAATLKEELDRVIKENTL